MKSSFVKYFLPFLFLGTSITTAQFGSSGSVDARSMGMAKTYNSTSTGLSAIGINPANLAFMDEGSVEFSTIIPVPFISFHSGTDFLSIEQLDYFFGGVDGKARVLNESDKQRLSDLFSDGGNVFANFSTSLFSLTLKPTEEAGSFGISIIDYAGGNVTIPQALVDLSLNGNAPGKKYEFNDQDLSSWWIRNYGLTYARSFQGDDGDWFKQLSAGITFKLVHGFYYTGLAKVNSSLETGAYNQIESKANMIGYSAFSEGFGVNYSFDSTMHESKFGLFMPPAGKGFGLDFGINFLLDDNWKISASLTDVGKINWSNNAAVFKTEGEIIIDDLTDQAQLDSLKDKFTGKGEKIESFSTTLPSAFRFGISHYFSREENFLPGTLLIALDYNQGFNNLPGNSKTPRLSFGIEWKPGDWIPYLRSGFSVGGVDGFAWALGLGIYIGLIEFNFATSYFQSIISPNTAKQISVAIDSRWKF